METLTFHNVNSVAFTKLKSLAQVKKEQKSCTK